MIPPTSAVLSGRGREQRTRVIEVPGVPAAHVTIVGEP